LICNQHNSTCSEWWHWPLRTTMNDIISSPYATYLYKFRQIKIYSTSTRVNNKYIVYTEWCTKHFHYFYLIIQLFKLWFFLFLNILQYHILKLLRFFLYYLRKIYLVELTSIFHKWKMFCTIIYFYGLFFWNYWYIKKQIWTFIIEVIYLCLITIIGP
jgi:hypothetical protein